MVKFGRHLQFFLELEGHSNDDTHDQVFNKGNDMSRTNHYIVPYNTLRDSIQSSSSSTSSSTSFQKDKLTVASFELMWKEALSKANKDLSESINTYWKIIFDSISSYQQQKKSSDECNNNDVTVTTRGMEVMDAVRVYTQISEIRSSRDLLRFLKDTSNAAEMNYEALRKIVKKFDKKYHFPVTNTNSNESTNDANNNLLSTYLLPELYSSILFLGRGTLETTISYLRELIEEMTSDTSSNDEEDSDGKLNFDSYSHSERNDKNDTELVQHEKNERQSINSEDDIDDSREKLNKTYGKKKSIDHQSKVISSSSWEQNNVEEESRIVEKRAYEVQWLNDIVKKIPQSELKHIVAHRGFHIAQGRSDYRPLENSLSAFETAWSAGIHLCECDIALTKDEKLVLAHDENFNRLALDKFSDNSRLKVSELTFKELIALTLKNGVRAPLLKDVLISANAIGPEAKLIIEIKPGNSEAGMALARFLAKYSELIAHVAVIMSFDLWSMHSLRAELQRLLPIYENHQALTLGTSSEQHRICDNGMGNKISSFINYDISQEAALPKLMLLTVADQSEKKFELCVDVSDYSPVDGWLNCNHMSLDGVYVRYQPQMLLPEGKEALQKLAKKYSVGVWSMVGEDPDNHTIMNYLVKECGVSFYNTDLPQNF